MTTANARIDPRMTLDEITTRYPETIEVFNRFGIDICCGGGATVAEAAERDGVRLGVLEEALKELIAPAPDLGHE